MRLPHQHEGNERSSRGAKQAHKNISVFAHHVFHLVVVRRQQRVRAGRRPFCARRGVWQGPIRDPLPQRCGPWWRPVRQSGLETGTEEPSRHQQPTLSRERKPGNRLRARMAPRVSQALSVCYFMIAAGAYPVSASMLFLIHQAFHLGQARQAGKSVQAGAGLFHHLAPLHAFGLDEGCELLGRFAVNLSALLVDLLFTSGWASTLTMAAIQLSQHGCGVTAWGQHAKPRSGSEPGTPASGDGAACGEGHDDGDGLGGVSSGQGGRTAEQTSAQNDGERWNQAEAAGGIRMLHGLLKAGGQNGVWWADPNRAAFETGTAQHADAEEKPPAPVPEWRRPPFAGIRGREERKRLRVSLHTGARQRGAAADDTAPGGD